MFLTESMLHELQGLSSSKRAQLRGDSSRSAQGELTPKQEKGIRRRHLLADHSNDAEPW